jgi:hypothetical protein
MPNLRSYWSVLPTMAVLALPAAADVRTFPGSAPCNATLQACIDGADPGDVVEIATNTAIDESLEVSKSLSLRPAAGFSPVIAALNSILLLNPAGEANAIVIEDLTLERGFVSAVQVSTDALDVRIAGLEVRDTFNGRAEIEVRTGQPGPFGPVTFEVSSNDLTVPTGQFNGAGAISIQGGNAATMRGVVRDNTILHFDGQQRGAIEVSNAIADLDVDVIGNRISGTNYNEGVSFFQFAEGIAQVRFINNLVTGQVAEAGAPGAFVVNVSGGSAQFEILNNTAAASDRGILVSGRTDLGATVSGLIANNVVADITGVGVGVDPELDVVNEFNLVFNTGSDFFTPGPGTLFVDPRFVGGDDFHLSAASQAVNAGNADRVPADITTDLDGLPRILGAGVDLGAFELQEAAAEGCATQPLTDCHVSATSSLALRFREGELAWQWRRGTTSESELGTPTTTTDYALCLYEERDGVPTLLVAATVPSGAGWKATEKGFRYRSASGAPDGVRRLQLKSGAPGKASIALTGRGMALPPLPLPQSGPVVVQLANSEGSCWTAAFPPPAKRNDDTRFVANGR